MPGRPALWTHGVTFIKPKHPWTSVSPRIFIQTKVSFFQVEIRGKSCL